MLATGHDFVVLTFDGDSSEFVGSSSKGPRLEMLVDWGSGHYKIV